MKIARLHPITSQIESYLRDSLPKVIVDKSTNEMFIGNFSYADETTIECQGFKYVSYPCEVLPDGKQFSDVKHLIDDDGNDYFYCELIDIPAPQQMPKIFDSRKAYNHLLYFLEQNGRIDATAPYHASLLKMIENKYFTGIVSFLNKRIELGYLIQMDFDIFNMVTKIQGVDLTDSATWQVI